MAGVYQISGKIEGSLANSVTQSRQYEEPVPQVAPLPEEQSVQLQQGNSNDEDPYRLW
ncbi:hypothetical protein D3C78_1861220 [compost metagenome]